MQNTFKLTDSMDFTQRGGKRTFTHQQILQMAWDLFHQGLLRYKIDRKRLMDLLRRKRKRRKGEDDGEFEGEGSSEFGGEDSEEDDDDDDDDDDESSKGKRKHRRFKRKWCPPPKEKDPDDEDYLVRVESVDSSVFGLDDEPDGRLKYQSHNFSLILNIC